jgi:hypothetical protein
VAWAQNDRNRGRGGGRGQSRPAAAATATAQTPSVGTRQSVAGARGMVRAEAPRATAQTQARVATRPTQSTVSRMDREGTARSTTSQTAIRSTADSRRFDRDGRGDWNRDRDRNWRDRDRDWSDRRYHRPPTTIYRNWDRGRIYSWNNNRWRWYGGNWIIYDASPSVVYTTEALPVVGSSVIASVQEELQDKGYSPGPADGVMGSRTRSAIAEFQEDRGLAVTGTINNSLLRSLGLM